MSRYGTTRARQAATDLAATLAQPALPDGGQRAPQQSLSEGAAGIALLHIERASSHIAEWDAAHAWLVAATSHQLNAGPDACLLVGAPAVAFAVHAAADSKRYHRTSAALHTRVQALTRRRLTQAHARIDGGERPAPSEYDLFHGLTGLGAYLLRSDPHGEVNRDVLAYLVRLTQPFHDGLPGWWTDHAPTGGRSPDYPGGHGNLGTAHGIAGPLALLSLAMRRGIVVPGHAEAIERICAWLDACRQDQPSGPSWPQWITAIDIRNRTPERIQPPRPSWCYGTPGLARAQQLAGIAIGDHARQQLAEDALIRCLHDAEQLARITDGGLCHGAAGLFQTVWRAAEDASSPTLADQVPKLLDILHDHGESAEGRGFLNGNAGLALALHTAATDTAPVSRWDACLLLT